MTNYELRIGKNRGYLLVTVLVFTSIALVLITSLSNWAGLNLRAAKTVVVRERAFQIAEAGIEYYRWHLAHAPQDFYDGQSASSTGPYTHNFYDKSGTLIGHFALTITPPSVGSTIVTIASRGTVMDDPSVSRTIEAKLAVASLAKYAFVSNSMMRFGYGTEVFGPIHSNQGIRFDGLTHNVITSAVSSYDDPDHNGANEYGVHTHVQAPPSAGVPDGGINSEHSSNGLPAPIRTDVFTAGRQFPVPAVDWSSLTQNMSALKSSASAGGRYISNSGALGYNIVLKTNDTFDLYKVTATVPAPHSCNKANNVDGQDGWDSWSISNQTLVANYPFPANGVIFVEDNVWVEGKINTARLTIASGRFPEDSNTYTSITVNHNLLYTNYDGRDVLALIAQNNINAGMVSDDTLEIDAALIAKNGRAGRYYYNGSCHPYDNRTLIKLYGMVASNLRYGFAYIDNNGNTNGYATRQIIYDSNLLYGPPPSFPLTSDQYTTISWREVNN